MIWLRKVLFLQDYLCDNAAYMAYNLGETNASEINKMKRILSKAIRVELTENQRFCLIEYYIHGRKMKDIAESLSLNPSTVTRHIRMAKDKLRHIASYY